MKRMWSRNELRKIIQETYGIDIDNLVDKNGHDRFPEGNVILSEGASGITLKYGRWSLSGTHLMIVAFAEYSNGAEFTDYQTLFECSNLPQWILDKIVPYKDVYVDSANAIITNDDWSRTTFSVSLTKRTNKIIIEKSADATLTKDGICRMSFDLLIDNA